METKVKESLKEVIEYLYEDERKDYDKNDPDHDNHIFKHIEIVKEFLDNQ